MSKFWFYLQCIFGGNKFTINEIDNHIERLKEKRNNCKADEFIYYTDEISYWDSMKTKG